MSLGRLFRIGYSWLVIDDGFRLRRDGRVPFGKGSGIVWFAGCGSDGRCRRSLLLLVRIETRQAGSETSTETRRGVVVLY